jgi:tetratricopeptide (TPR) repeat protein
MVSTKKEKTTILTFFQRIINYLENYPIGFWQWIIAFLAIVYIRNFFESFSGRIPVPFPIAYILQYTLAFINPLLALSIILSLFSKERIEKVTRLMLFAWLFTLTPPLFDIISGRVKSAIGYLPLLENKSLLFAYLNFFNPFITLPGTTIGIRLETVIACLLGFIYVYIKSRRINRAIFSVIIIYLVSIAFYTLPYNIFNAWKLVWPKLPHATELYLGEGTIVRNPFFRLTYSIANDDLILLALLLLLWSRLFAKNLFHRICSGIFSINSLISSIYYIIGILFGLTIFYHSTKFAIQHPFDIVVPITLLLAVLIISGFNHILNSSRNNEIDQTKTDTFILLILAFFALSYAAVLGFGSFVVILVLISISLIRYVFPQKNNKLFFLDPFFESLLNLSFIFLGFSIFARENISQIFSTKLVVAVAILLILQNYLVFTKNRRLMLTFSLVWIAGIFCFPFILKSSISLPSILIVTLIFAALIFMFFIFSKLKRFSHAVNFAFIFIILILFRNQIPSLTEAANCSPQAYARTLLGDYFTISRERECANIEIEQAIKLGCREIQAVITAAYNYSLLGQTDQAIEKYRLATEIDPNSIYAHSELARNLYQKGQTDEAYLELKKVLKLDPQNKTALTFINQQKYNVADTTIRKNEILNAAQTEFRKNNLDKAVELAKSALALDSTFLPAYDLLGTIFEKTSQFDSVIVYYQKAVRYDPKDTRYKFLDFLLTHNYWAQAIIELNALAKLAPNDTKVLLNLGFAYLQTNQANFAEKQFLRATELDSKDLISRYNLGLYYSKENRLNDAIKYLREAVTIAPNNLETRNLLGECYSKKGLINDAIKEWQTCLQINPNFQPAQENLNKIKR